MAEADRFHWRKETIIGLDRHEDRCEKLAFESIANAWLIFAVTYWLNLGVMREAKDRRRKVEC